MGAKEGDWIEIKYKDKKISIQIREVDEHPELKWKENIAWIRLEDAKKLDLKGISDSPIDPNRAFSIYVHKHLLPRSKILYLAILTFILGAIAAVVGGIVQAGLAGDQKLVLGITALVFTLLTMASSGISALVQKQ